MPTAALRTPDDRFENLPAYPWSPHYVDDLPGFEGLRLHHLDEGAGPTFLCLHGQPTWSFLYRKMLPVFTGAGGRVVAPDFFGFGKSDKPTDDAAYSFAFHRDSLLRLIERLDLRDITLVCQDWGGLIGLTLPMAMPDRFSRLIVMNTTLASGQHPGEGFTQWLAYVRSRPDLDVGRLMRRSVQGITDAETAAYDAPFPDVTYKAGVRTFPHLVPVTPEMPGAALSLQAVRWFKQEWDKPTFMAIGEQDPVLGPPVMHSLRKLFKTCPDPLILPQAGHFVQEHGVAVAQAALTHFGGA